jgi:hypothetical protein
MNEQAPNIEAPAPEVEAKALGWAPKENWRGDPEHWVDAETFLKRGKEMMPLLKATNKQLEAKLAKQAADLAAATTTIKEFEATLKDLTEFQAEVVKDKVASELATLKAQRREARNEDDFDTVDALDERIDELKEKGKALKATPPAKEEKPGPQSNLDPAYVKWAEGREWLKDPVKGTTAVGVAQKLRQAGNTDVGEAFYDAVEAEVLSIFNEAPVRKPSKLEGGGGGGGGGGGPKVPSYDSLPAEAKAVCDRQAAKFVGEKGKAFKDLASWRAHYAKIYLES